MFRDSHSVQLWWGRLPMPRDLTAAKQALKEELPGVGVEITPVTDPENGKPLVAYRFSATTDDQRKYRPVLYRHFGITN